MNKNKKFCDKQCNNYVLNDNRHCQYDEGPFGAEYVIVMTTVMAVMLVIEYFSR